MAFFYSVKLTAKQIITSNTLWFSIMLLLVIPVIFVELVMHRLIPSEAMVIATFIGLAFFAVAVLNVIYAVYRSFYHEATDDGYDIGIVIISLPAVLFLIANSYRNDSFWLAGILMITYIAMVTQAQLMYEQQYRK